MRFKGKTISLLWVVGLLLVSVLVSCESEERREEMKIEVKSSAFTEGGMIPKKYTCDGANVSPPLTWSNVPPGTKSLALVGDDPDAAMGAWVHWVVFNIPPNVKELKEGVPPQKSLTDGTEQGITDFGSVGYGGPCPPSGTHRYLFKLYALDTKVDLPAGTSKDELLRAMKGHILGEGQLMGKYKRQ